MSTTQIGFMIAMFITGLLTLTFAGADTGAEKARYAIASLVMAVILGAGLGLLPQG
jgi:hypothetical protein